MNKLYIVLLSFCCLIACGNQAKVDTDIVKAHTLHLEQLTDTTNMIAFLKGIKPHSSWGDRKITDNRLLKYAGIPIESFSFKDNEDTTPTTVTIVLFKDSENEDGEAISKYLTGKFGEAEVDEYDKNKSTWINVSKTTSYSLKIAEEGYSNDSELTIYFRNNTNNYY